MKKSLLLWGMCLAVSGIYAQDDDVYFVPSSEEKTETQDIYVSETSSYEPISEEETFESSNWAAGRGNGEWDVDAYNRRGKYYEEAEVDTLSAEEIYQDGYEDGYEDGYYTSRIVRFWSPRPGVYVSSPYYWDYYDLCYTYDPWYYGYGSPWSWGWSGWYGWGSWYGWRPYYSSWYWGWGWHSPWYDPWWGGPSYAWRPNHWIPANAQRGAAGGWVARGGSRGSGVAGGLASTSRSRTSGLSSGRSSSAGRSFGTTGSSSRSTRSSLNSRSLGSSRSFGTSNSGTTQTTRSTSRSFGNSSSNSINSSSRSSRSVSSGSSFGTSRSSFGGSGGRSFGGGGGGRGGGGRR